MLVDSSMWSRNSFSFEIVVLIATWVRDSKETGKGKKEKVMSNKLAGDNIKPREDYECLMHEKGIPLLIMYNNTIILLKGSL